MATYAYTLSFVVSNDGESSCRVAGLFRTAFTLAAGQTRAVDVENLKSSGKVSLKKLLAPWEIKHLSFAVLADFPTYGDPVFIRPYGHVLAFHVYNSSRKSVTINSLTTPKTVKAGKWATVPVEITSDADASVNVTL